MINKVVQEPESSSVWCYGEMAGGQCGIGRIRNFLQIPEGGIEQYTDMGYFPVEESGELAYPSLSNVKHKHKGGTGLFGSGFINTAECKLAFDKLTAKYPVVFQSPKRNNVNSNHMFIYIMFDSKRNSDVQYIQAVWPFKAGEY